MLPNVLSPRSQDTKQINHPCFINKLPYEVLEMILLFMVVDVAPRLAQHRLRQTRLVCNDWRTQSDYLALVNFYVYLGEKDTENRARVYISTIKAFLEGTAEAGRSPCRPCTHLSVEVDRIVLYTTFDFESWIIQLFQLVGHSLKYLELSFLKVPWPKPALSQLNQTYQGSVPFHFPQLQKLTVSNTSTRDIFTLLRATGSEQSHPAPSELVIHQIPGADREQHVLSVPAALLGPSLRRTEDDIHSASNPLCADRGPLEVYVEGNSSVLVTTLKTLGLPHARTNVLKLWITDPSEMPEGFDDLIRQNRWKKYIAWDAKPVSPRDSHVCNRRCDTMYAARCKADIPDDSE